MRKNDLFFATHGSEYMSLCLDVTVYWLGQMRVKRRGILSFYRSSLELIGPSLRTYETEEMAGALALTEDALSLIPRWCDDPEEREIRSLVLESRDEANMPSDKAIQFYAVRFKKDFVGAFRLVLPCSFIDGSPRSLEALCHRLVSGFEFHSGHSGYSINWDPKGPFANLARRRMGMLALRYPCIDLPDILCTLMAIRHGIKRVNWITLLGESLVHSIGDLGALMSRLQGTSIRLEMIEHGVMFVAGSEPVVGDVNHSEPIDSYRDVGRLVSVIRTQVHPPFLGSASQVIDEMRTRDWLGYFDR